VVAEDGAVEDVKAQLRSWGWLFVIDDQFAVWRDHAGDLAWSTDATVIGGKLRLLHAFRSRARYADHGAVVALLRGLLKQIEARPRRRQQGRTTPRATSRRLRRPRR
jgi:predicted aminopeptidase